MSRVPTDRVGRRVVAGAAVVTVLAACGSSGTDQAAEQPTPDVSASPLTPTPTPTASASAAADSGALWAKARDVIVSKGLGEWDSPTAPVPAGTLTVASTPASGKVADYAFDDTESDTVDGGSFAPSISADGRTVAFESSALNLVPGDTNRKDTSDSGVDIFVKDLRSGAIMPASTSADGTQADGESTGASLSGDGRTVGFISTAANLVPDDTNGVADVFVKELDSGRISRVSTTASGEQLAAAAAAPALSTDGTTIAFVIDATAKGARKKRFDLSVRNLGTGVLTRVARVATGNKFETMSPSLSADGSVLAFLSTDPLVPGDTNAKTDVFVENLRTGRLTRASTLTGGDQIPDGAAEGRVSPDGSAVVFVARTPGPRTARDYFVFDVLVKDLSSGRTPRVGKAFNGSGAGLPADGRHVVFLDDVGSGNVHVTTRH